MRVFKALLKRRAGFTLSVLLISCTALMGMVGTHFFVRQREEARDMNTTQVVRAMSGLLNATNQHYAEFIDVVMDEIEYYKEHGSMRATAQSSIVAAWDTTLTYSILEGEDTEETSTEFIARLNFEDVQDPIELKFVQSCNVTSRVMFMMKDKVDLGSFPFSFVPGLWTVKINLQCSPGYFYSTEALNRVSSLIRLYGESNAVGDFENINVSINKLTPSEIELQLTYAIQSRDWSYY